MSWRIENDFISPDSIPDNGNRLLVATDIWVSGAL